MTKKDYERYQEIKEECSQYKQDILDIQNDLRDAYIKRDRNSIKKCNKQLELAYFQLNIRETIQSEILLPKSLKIDDGMECLESFWKDNNIEPNNGDIEEFVSNYLTDYYNHDIYGFTFAIKGKDIYVTKIRWNEKQILISDLVDLFRGKIRKIENCFVKVTKDAILEHSLVITHKMSGYVQGARTLRKAISILENHYYM